MRRVGVLLAAFDRHLSGDLTFGVFRLMSDPFNTVCYEVQFILYKGYWFKDTSVFNEPVPLLHQFIKG